MEEARQCRKIAASQISAICPPPVGKLPLFKQPSCAFFILRRKLVREGDAEKGAGK